MLPKVVFFLKIVTRITIFLLFLVLFFSSEFSLLAIYFVQYSLAFLFGELYLSFRFPFRQTGFHRR